MEQTVFRIKGKYPESYSSNIYVFNIETKEMQFFEHYYSEKSYEGEIWVDGVKLDPKRAMELRPDFCDENQAFTWGYTSHMVRITSISICLHIFKDEEIALNMYMPFMRTYMDKWERKSFEITIDLTDFIIDFRERFNPNFHTRYFSYSYFGNHEINIIKAPLANKYSVALLDQIARDLVEKEKEQKEVKDWDIVFEEKKKHLQEYYFIDPVSTVSQKTLKQAIKITGNILRAYYNQRKRDAWENSKDIREQILAIRRKYPRG